MSLFGPPNVRKLKEKRDIKGLIRALDSNHFDKIEKKGISELAVAALVELNDPAAVEILVKRLKNKRLGSESQGSAGTALSALGGKTAVQALISVLGEKDLYADQKLGKCKDPYVNEALLELFQSSSPEQRNLALKALQWRNDPAFIEPLMRAIQEEPDKEKRFSLGTALCKIGDPAVEPLGEWILHGSDQDKQEAVNNLARIQTQCAAEKLILALHFPSVQRSAIFYMDSWKGPVPGNFFHELYQAKAQEAESLFDRFPQSWQDNPRHRATLSQILQERNGGIRPGSSCPYFSLSVCMFRVKSRQDSSMGPERCSFTVAENDLNNSAAWRFENCFVWKMDPK